MRDRRQSRLLTRLGLERVWSIGRIRGIGVGVESLAGGFNRTETHIPAEFTPITMYLLQLRCTSVELRVVENLSQ